MNRKAIIGLPESCMGVASLRYSNSARPSCAVSKGMYPRLVSLCLAPYRARYASRVFTGDDRPSMMARGPRQQSSTLIDPTSLNQRPTSQNMLSGSEARPNLARRGSRGGKPLLNFDEDRSPGLQAASPAVGQNKTRSVFGVDTLWEREMTKLE